MKTQLKFITQTVLVTITSVILVLGPSARAANTAFDWNTDTTNALWSVTGNWVAAPGFGAGNIVDLSRISLGIGTSTLDTSITIGAVEIFGLQAGMIVNVTGGNTITMDGTGITAAATRAKGSFVSGEAAIWMNRNNNGYTHLSVNPNIIMLNTALGIGGRAASEAVTIGGNIVNGDTVTRQLNLRGASSGAGHVNGPVPAYNVTINGSIGATLGSGGGGITISNGITGAGSANLAGAIGGATGTGAAITIVNAATGTGGFNISGALGQTVSAVTQNSGTSTMKLSGNNANYAGTTTLTLGSLNLANQNALQNSILTMNGGSLIFDSTVGGNAFTLGGLSASSSGAGYDIALQNNAGTPGAITLTVGNNNTDTTYAGVLSAAGSLIKVGNDKLTLSGANTYTGTTTISAGTLQVNGSIAAGSTVTVASAGTLSGTGTLSGAVTVNGTLKAGSSVGTLTVGALALANGGTNEMEVINAAGAPGTGYDTVVVTNNIGVPTSGTFTIKLLSLNGSGAAGSVTNFNYDTSYVWTNALGTLTNAGSIANVIVNDSSFNNDLAGGQFVVEPGSLNLRFTNNHPPTASILTNIYCGKGVAIKGLVIAEADLLAGASDPDADTVAFDSVSGTNATATRAGGNLNISVSNDLNSDEYIEYRVNDTGSRTYRVGDTVRRGTNYIHIVRTNSIGSVSIARYGDGTNVTVTFYGIPNYTYVWERDDNVNFTSPEDVYTTNLSGGLPVLIFTEVPPVGNNFYRVRLQ